MPKILIFEVSEKIVINGQEKEITKIRALNTTRDFDDDDCNLYVDCDCKKDGNRITVVLSDDINSKWSKDWGNDNSGNFSYLFGNEEGFEENKSKKNVSISADKEIYFTKIDDSGKQVFSKSFKNEEEFNEWNDYVNIKFELPTTLESQSYNPNNYKYKYRGIFIWHEDENGKFGDDKSTYNLTKKEGNTQYTKIPFKKDAKIKIQPFKRNEKTDSECKPVEILVEELIKRFDIYKYRESSETDIVVNFDNSGEVKIYNPDKEEEDRIKKEKMQKKSNKLTKNIGKFSNNISESKRKETSKISERENLNKKIETAKKIIIPVITLTIIFIATTLLTLGLFTGGVAPVVLTPLIAKCLIGVFGGIGLTGFFASLITFWFIKTFRNERDAKQNEIDDIQKEINPIEQEIEKLRNERDKIESGIKKIESDSKKAEDINNEPEMLKNENENEYGD